MVLHLDQAPALVTDVLVDGLRGMVQPGGPPAAGRLWNVEQIGLPKPLPLYTATLQTALEGRVLADAQQTGWQFLVLEGEEPAAFAEVVPAGGANFEMQSLSRSTFSDTASRAIEVSAEIANDRPEELTLRLLRIPALHTMVVWLHEATVDLIVPLAPAHYGLEPMRAVIGPEFSALLQAAAQSQLSQSSPP